VELQYYLEKRVFRKDQLVMQEGKECHSMAVVLDGVFEITKLIAST